MPKNPWNFPTVEKQASKAAAARLVRVDDLTQTLQFGKIEMPPPVDLDAFEALLINGKRGWGKTALGQVLLESFYYGGRVCLVLTEAPFSYESLFTAIPAPGKEPHPCLFIVPPGCYLKWDENRYDIVTMESTESIKKVLLTAKDENRIVVFCHSLWPPEDEVEAYKILANWINKAAQVQRTLRNDMAVLMSEIEMQGYARMKSKRSSKELKVAMLDLIRLARSSYRMSVIADLQLTRDLDVALRDQVDKLFMKRQDPKRVPDALKWVPRKIERRRESFQHSALRDRLFPSLNHLYKYETYYVFDELEQLWKLETGLPDHWHRRQRDELTDFGIAPLGFGYKPLDNPDLEQFRKRFAGLPRVREIPTATRKLIVTGAVDLNKQGHSWHSIAKAVGLNSGNLFHWMKKFEINGSV